MNIKKVLKKERILVLWCQYEGVIPSFHSNFLFDLQVIKNLDVVGLLIWLRLLLNSVIDEL